MFDIGQFNDASLRSLYSYNYDKNMTGTGIEKESKDNPFVSVNLGSSSLRSLFSGWASKEFRLAGEFRGDVLSARAGVFNIQDIREERARDRRHYRARKTRKESRGPSCTAFKAILLAAINKLIFVVDKFIMSSRLARTRSSTANTRLFRIKQCSRSYSSNYSCLKNEGRLGGWFLSVVLHLNPKFYT